MRRCTLLAPVAALLLFAPAASAMSPRQAIFDVKATGHYVYDHTEDWQPGGQCPLNRGTAHTSQTLDVTVHYRAKVQASGSRWYVTPLHGKEIGHGKLHKTHSKNIEK